MIYRAFLNRQEITGFPVDGIETDEIYGGNTLFWKKKDAQKPKLMLRMRAAAGDDYNYYDKQLLLPTDNAVPLSDDNIEMAAYVYEKYYRNSSNLLTCDMSAHLLIKAKTEEVRKNIGKIYFLSSRYSGKQYDEAKYLPPDYPYREEDLDRYTKEPSKLIYSNNVFSAASYNTSSYSTEESNLAYGGISMFNNFHYTFYIGLGINPTLFGKPDLVFKTKAELINWALS